MRSLTITRFGGPEVLNVTESPSPPLMPDGVRIKVSAAGINFADIMMRVGTYPEAPRPPFVPGYEVAGLVVETGPKVQTIKVGERVVAGSKFGGYTDEIVLPEFQVRKIPPRLTDIEAAAIPVNFMTAWVALEEMARVRKGDRVLIQSAAGGVGVAAVQIAAQAGAYVVGLVGNPAKFQAVKTLGAHEAQTTESWENANDRDAGGFDVILDPTGGETLKKSLRRLAPGGRVINFGISSLISGNKRSLLRVGRTLLKTPILTPFQLMMGNKGIFGLNMLQFFGNPSEMKKNPHGNPMGRALDQVLERFEQGRLRVIVGKTFPLSEGGKAHLHLQSRANIGKVVLTMSS